MAIGTAAAIIGSAVIGAGVSASAASKQAKAAKNAANQAAATASQEMEMQREARDEARKIFTPYSQEGAAARRIYNGAMGIGVGGSTDPAALAAARADYDTSFEASPFWRDAQYATGQAMNALNSTNAAMGRGGSINSGKALRAASDIQQGYRGAATQNYLTSLGGIVDTGLVADSGIASGGQAYANNAGNALRNATALQGQYNMAGANAWADAASNIAGFAGYAAGNWPGSKGNTGASNGGGNSYFPGANRYR